MARIGSASRERGIRNPSRVTRRDRMGHTYDKMGHKI